MRMVTIMLWITNRYPSSESLEYCTTMTSALCRILLGLLGRMSTAYVLKHFGRGENARQDPAHTNARLKNYGLPDSDESGSDSTQPLHISTALVHSLYIFLLSAADFSGLKIVRLSRLISLSSWNSFQISTAKPAAIAAPNAVVSRMAGRSTGMPMMSAWVCIQRSELLMPPSTASSDNFCLESFSMASRMALVWKHVASRVARAIWPF